MGRSDRQRTPQKEGSEVQRPAKDRRQNGGREQTGASEGDGVPESTGRSHPEKQLRKPKLETKAQTARLDRLWIPYGTAHSRVDRAVEWTSSHESGGMAGRPSRHASSNLRTLDRSGSLGSGEHDAAILRKKIGLILTTDHIRRRGGSTQWTRRFVNKQTRAALAKALAKVDSSVQF
ncbi:hypothetical protein KOR42_22310 [Thalassoglobus neptunius]|uniref:Uncharacterized protein n=1 Tax=Thalassoglobus neptunius TaxID=1938619 RepID=A0A5C5X7G0_9PLAN|nr:hypothetical protein KOR42_22310 [Thalassoglobus neptunius]